jgi:EmrB/QacA subfamily drug resistance transporter
VLLVAIFGQFMGPFDSSVVNLAIKSIGNDLGGDITSLSWIITGYLIVFATFNLSSGRLADIRGRKNTYVLGISIFTISSALCGLAPSVNVLIATRLVQALGGSMMAGNSVALLSTFYPLGERGRAFGITSSSVYAGLAAGPSAGGFLIQYFGWRSIFYVNVPLGIVVLLVALFLIRGEMPKGRKEKFDIRGAVIYGVAIAMSLLGVNYLGKNFEFGLSALLFGIAFLAVFVFLQSRTVHPLLDLGLFRENRLFAFTVMTTFVNYVSTFGISFVMSLYEQLGLGYTPLFAGLVLLAQPITQVLTAPFGGWLSDRVEPRYQTSISMTIICISIFSLATLGLGSSPWDIIVRLAVLGLGYGFFSPANTNAAMGSVARSRFGVASGITSTMRNTGQAISLSIVIYILSVTLHESASNNVALQSVQPALMVVGLRAVLLVLGVINAIGIFTSLNRGRKADMELEEEET